MNIVGLDIGGTSIKAGLISEEGTVEQFQEYSSDSHKGGEYVMDKAVQIIKTFKQFDAIGLSTAGQVDSANGTIRYANENIPNYTGMPVKEILQQAFNVPVKVENDVNAAALGEHRFGSGKGLNDFLCLTYGTGIGGAIMVDGAIYKGLNGCAAEFGHMLTHPNGLLCNCGNRGCYEAYASTNALVKAAEKIDKTCKSGKDLFNRIHKEDPKMRQLLDEWVDEIAIGLVSLIHIFNPPAIILGGGIMEQSSLVPIIAKKVKNNVMGSFADLQITGASLGNKAGILGAASLHL